MADTSSKEIIRSRLEVLWAKIAVKRRSVIARIDQLVDGKGDTKMGGQIEKMAMSMLANEYTSIMDELNDIFSSMELPPDRMVSPPEEMITLMTDNET